MFGELLVEGLIFADNVVEDVTGISPAAAVLTAGVVTAGVVGAIVAEGLEEDSAPTSALACKRCGKESIHTKVDGWHILNCSDKDCGGYRRVRIYQHERWNKPVAYEKPTEIRKRTIKERILEAISDYCITIPSVEKHRCERVGHEYVGKTTYIYKYPVQFDEEDGEFAYELQVCGYKCDNCDTWHDLDGTEEVVDKDIIHKSKMTDSDWKKVVKTGFARLF